MVGVQPQIFPLPTVIVAEIVGGFVVRALHAGRQ